MIALWYVPDELAAANLRAALALDWAEQVAEVRIGERPPGHHAVEWDGGTVRAWGPDGVRAAAAPDPHVAVLFVRTWTLHPEAAGPERFLPPLPEPESWIPPEPPAAARISDPGDGSTTITDRRSDDRRAFAVGVGTRQSTDQPLSLGRGRFVLETSRRRAFVDLAACAWAEADAERFVRRVHGGEHVVELAVDRSAFSLVGGWRRGGPRPLYLYGGPELRVAEWQLYVDGQGRGGVARALVPALVVGAGAGWASGFVEVRALPYVRATTVGPPVGVGVNVDVLVRFAAPVGAGVPPARPAG